MPKQCTLRVDSVKDFTDAEKINLFISCAKACGLNDRLQPDGTLGEQAKIAAGNYLQEASRHYLRGPQPDLALIEAALAKLVPEERQRPRLAIRMFFAEHGIVLP